MSNASPNSLSQKPQLNITKYGKKPLYLVMLVMFLLAAILVSSVQLSGKKEETKRKVQQPISVREDESTILTAAEAPSGVAKEAEKTPPAEDVPLVNVVKPATPSEEYIARKREWEKIKQYRLASEVKALSSPMAISVPAPPQRSTLPATNQSIGPNRGMPIMPTTAMPPQQGEYNQAERIDKEKFYQRAERDKWQLGHRRVAGADFELKTGTIIPGMLITGIKSDLPGEISGQVSSDVYDTATGNYLLIPRGSKIHGVYDSRVVLGQERVLVAWSRILFPDGSSITLGAMPGADMAGYSGFHGSVDNHTWKIFGNALLMSLISGGAAYAMDSAGGGSSSSDNPSVLNEMGGALASQMNQTSTKLLQRNSSIKPSLGLEPGYRFNVVVTKDIVFDGPYEAWR